MTADKSSTERRSDAACSDAKDLERVTFSLGSRCTEFNCHVDQIEVDELARIIEDIREMMRRTPPDVAGGVRAVNVIPRVDSEGRVRGYGLLYYNDLECQYWSLHSTHGYVRRANGQLDEA